MLRPKLVIKMAPKAQKVRQNKAYLQRIKKIYASLLPKKQEAEISLLTPSSMFAVSLQVR